MESGFRWTFVFCYDAGERFHFDASRLLVLCADSGEQALEEDAVPWGASPPSRWCREGRWRSRPQATVWGCQTRSPLRLLSPRGRLAASSGVQPKMAVHTRAGPAQPSSVWIVGQQCLREER